MTTLHRILSISLWALAAPSALGCVDVTHQTGPLPPDPKRAPPASGEIKLPTGELFPGCAPGSKRRGYPDVPGAIATYCVTEVEPARRHGPFISFYPSGKKLARGAFLAGDPDGFWTTYYESGKKLSEGVYRQGIRDEKWQFYREDGALLLEEQLRSGARMAWRELAYDKDGLRQTESFVHDEAGRPVSQGPASHIDDGGNLLSGKFEMGKAEGLWEEKAERGKGPVLARIAMSDGFAAGKIETFWPKTGKPSATGEMIKTLPSGDFVLYAEGGEKRAEVTFEKGLFRSLKVFHPNGAVALSGGFEDGAPHSGWTLYHPNGKVKASGSYSKGLRVGTWQSADDQGKLIAEGRYDSGLLVEGKTVLPIDWTSLGLAASLQHLMDDLAWITSERGRVQNEQRAIAECLLFGDPVRHCRALDWENFRAQHEKDGPLEIDRRQKHQDLSCAMNNPLACARAGLRLMDAWPAMGGGPAGVQFPGVERPMAMTKVAGYYLKACDLAPLEDAFVARGTPESKSGMRAAIGCVWLGRLLAKGEAKSKVLAPKDLYKKACDAGVEEGCQALAEEPKKAPKP